MSTLTEMLAELERLRKAAPPGPWRQGPHYKTDVESSRGRVANGCPQFTPAGEASAAFIAFCGTHAEALIAAVREVVEEREHIATSLRMDLKVCGAGALHTRLVELRGAALASSEGETE